MYQPNGNRRRYLALLCVYIIAVYRCISAYIYIVVPFEKVCPFGGGARIKASEKSGNIQNTSRNYDERGYYNHENRNCSAQAHTAFPKSSADFCYVPADGASLVPVCAGLRRCPVFSAPSAPEKVSPAAFSSASASAARISFLKNGNKPLCEFSASSAFYINEADYAENKSSDKVDEQILHRVDKPYVEVSPQPEAFAVHGHVGYAVYYHSFI